MKHTLRYAIYPFVLASSICIACSSSVFAEEMHPHRMEPNVEYAVDLDGDGTAENLSYLSYTNEVMDGEILNNSNAVLDLFLDKNPFWSITDEDWSYFWHLFKFELDDGRTYLMASSLSDNDWTNQVLILTKEPGMDEMHVLDDLTSLTRSEGEITENKLGGWARATALESAEGNEFTVRWLLSTMSTGNIELAITYTLENGQITVKDAPITLIEPKEWTSWQNFDVQVSPEDSSIAFHVAPKDKVTLTEFRVYNNHYYLKCQNAAGQEGWIYDPDDIISEMPEGSDIYLMGYFEEAIFAG